MSSKNIFGKYIKDPSNKSKKYLRTKIRNLRKPLENSGIKYEQIFRSIENNSYLARSANKGISAFINNKGQIIKSLTPNETGSIELDVPILNNKFNNKNDLIFFILLITYMAIFFIFKKND